MTPSQLKIGMHFANQGTTPLKVYDGLDGTGNVMVKIKPGAYIGQVADIRTGPGGTVLDFVSEKISSSGSIVDKAEVFLFSWLPESVKLKIAGGVKYSDLAAAVSEKQLQEQVNAMQIAEANGSSLQKSIIKVAKNVGETVSTVASELIPWKIVGGLGVAYVLLNWDKFKSK